VTRRERFDYLSDMGCILCSRLGMPGTPAEIHHIRAGQGMGQRAPDNKTIPLCPEHHRGDTGVHGLGTRGFAARWCISEEELLEIVDAMLPR
jgi:hypothetical protein